jgi:hypothetical protein
LSSDFGPLLLRGIDRQIGLTERLAAAIHDHRHPSSIDHSLRHLLAQRILLHLPSSCPVKALLHRVTALLSVVPVPALNTS